MPTKAPTRPRFPEMCEVHRDTSNSSGLGMLGFVDALCGEGWFLRKGLVVVLPTVSRRQLLRGGLFGLGALVAVSSWPSLLGLASKALVPANLTFASFSRHVGTTFRVHVGPNRSVDLKLVQVTQLARPTAGVIPAS